MIKFIDLLRENTEETDKDKIIADLQEELKLSNNRLIYEKNKYEKLLEGFKKGVYSGIQKHTKIVIDDIEYIANHVPGKYGDELKNWVDNLKSYFESLGEKNKN